MPTSPKYTAISRRKKRIRLTILSGVVLLAVITAAVVLVSGPDRPYRPGEAIKGITADLSRSLPDDFPLVTFNEVSAVSGIHFEHFWRERTIQLPEDMGSGAAWGDYNNDGWPDLFIVNMVGPVTLEEEKFQSSPARCVLYQNNGDGSFSDKTDAAGVGIQVWGMAAAWGDVDNDGWLDLFVSCYGSNRFFKNNGDGTFSERTAQSGFGASVGFWSGVCWFDYDRDGYIDLYVCGYVKFAIQDETVVTQQYNVDVPASINPSSFEPERNLLYKNSGDGTFTEVAKQAGVLNEEGRSLSVSACDFDDDGWQDLYIANDVSDNVLYRNRGDGRFEAISHEAWVADYRGAMGIATGDWDNDADKDLFITHWIAQENALYSNMHNDFNRFNPAQNPGLRFMDEADRFGLGQIALDYIGWGTSFFDYNNDGLLDLFVANGSTFQEKNNPHLLVAMQDKLFWNRGRGFGFFDVSAVSGPIFERKYVGRGAAFADYDNDGDVDIFVVNNVGPAMLLRNDGGNEKAWLKVSLQGERSNRQALGTKLRLVSGHLEQFREVGIQSSYCSQNSLVQHFGLAGISQVDLLEIEWPSGIKQTFSKIDVRQHIYVVEGSDTITTR